MGTGKIALALACLVCLGHGKRVHRLKQLQEMSDAQALASLLLKLAPESGFTFSGHAARLPRRSVALTGSRPAKLNAASRFASRGPVMTSTGGPALLLDCDGTLVETERDGHRVAFNQAFKQVGIDAEWDVDLYGELLTTGGGKERMTRYFKDYNPGAWPHPDPVSKSHPAIVELHKIKTKLFMEIVEAGQLPLREGIRDLIDSAKAAGWTLAVCSTSNQDAVQAVINTNFPDIAPTTPVFAGDVVKKKKPDPEIYNMAASELGLDPSKCWVVEDSNIGLQSGKAAGMKVLVTRAIYSKNEDFEGADFDVSSCDEIDFEKDLAPLVA